MRRLAYELRNHYSCSPVPASGVGRTDQGLSEPPGRDECFRLVLLTWDHKAQLLLPAQAGKESLSCCPPGETHSAASRSCESRTFKTSWVGSSTGSNGRPQRLPDLCDRNHPHGPPFKRDRGDPECSMTPLALRRSISSAAIQTCVPVWTVSHRRGTGNCCRGPVHRYPGRSPSARQCSFACPYNLSPGKISPRRTVPLTKLVQGKQSIADHVCSRIADHVCSRMFVDLNTDALHLKTDGRGRSRDTIRYPLPFFPERYLDNFLLLSGSVRRFRYFTGFLRKARTW